MARLIALIALTLSLVLAAPLSAQDEELENALDALRTALGDSESDANSVKLLKDFLKEYPDTKYTASALNAVAYYQGTSAGDRDGAIDYVKSHIASLEVEDQIVKSKVVLASLYDEPSYTQELRTIVEEINGSEELSFRHYDTLINTAFGAQDWELALDLVDEAEEEATPEEVAEDYPDADEETVAERSQGRILDLDVYEGWALANTGSHKEALGIFESAEERSELDYFGVPDGMLNVYWGKTLLMTGEEDGAVDKLLPVVLWAESESARDAMEEIYESRNGSDDGFEDYLFEQRLKHARKMDKFSAADYEGKNHDSEVLMGKVTLVAFWFPT